jgi:hypothetical protein
MSLVSVDGEPLQGYCTVVWLVKPTFDGAVILLVTLNFLLKTKLQRLNLSLSEKRLWLHQCSSCAHELSGKHLYIGYGDVCQ